MRGSAVGAALVCGNNNVVNVIYGSEMLRGRAAELLDKVSPVPAVEIGSNPYKGLNAFDETSSQLFFGREALTEKLIGKLATLWHKPASLPRMLAIMGPSGCGKSSIARAGIMPRLAKGDVPGLQNATVAILQPGPHPVEALGLAFARLATGDKAPASKAREFSDELSGIAPCLRSALPVRCAVRSRFRPWQKGRGPPT